MIEESYFTEYERRMLAECIRTGHELGYDTAASCLVAREYFHHRGLADPGPLIWCWSIAEIRDAFDQPPLMFDRQPRC